MRTFVAFSLFIFTACATSAKYNLAVKNWVGEKGDALVAEWGAPDSTFQMDDGGKVFTYERDLGSRAVYNSYLKTAVIKSKTCKTEFYLDAKGTISRTRIEGSGCKSR